MIVLVALVYNCTCDKIYREYENDYAIPDITHGCGLLVWYWLLVALVLVLVSKMPEQPAVKLGSMEMPSMTYIIASCGRELFRFLLF
jgi:hypothetical protein